MRVAEVMRTGVKTARPDDTVGEAVVSLADGHLSALPVVDGRGQLVGVLSTSDILTAVAEAGSPEERGRLFSETLVRELMTPRVITIEPDEDVEEAARRMLYLEVHRLFVTDHGRLVGVISQTDIVGAVATAKL
ncbi:MAG TPA: CBS domain-containing protein [Gemmatimonadales bacterium]|nr:CBS domain-containing protein [Gemmatimonadales bacterium]